MGCPLPLGALLHCGVVVLGAHSLTHSLTGYHAGTDTGVPRLVMVAGPAACGRAGVERRSIPTVPDRTVHSGDFDPWRVVWCGWAT